MKNNNNVFKYFAIVGGLLISFGALALTEEEKKALCKAPKVLGFNLQEYSSDNKVEVSAESEIHFTISGWTDINTLVVTAKKEKLPLNIENKNLFYKVSTKLPASLNGQFVRVNVDAKAEFGCRGSRGWLLKVADAAQPSSSAETVITPQAETPAAKTDEIDTENQGSQGAATVKEPNQPAQ